ncbi:MAG: hypothetical protein DCC71_04120 [Proteobacteria bacterium]|nr:MAG: hypothetical protein DCC71_04120 [Pseudomonadota bacterium]
MSAVAAIDPRRHAQAQAQRIVETVNVALPSSVNRRVLTLTGSVAGEGVTTVAWTIACALAQDAANRVLYVDANFDAPASERLLAAPAGGSLVSFLLARCDLDEAIRPAKDEPAIAVLASGRGDAAHVGSIMDVQVEKAIGLLRASFSYVLIDAAPPSDSPFTLLLARHSDGAILVTEAGATPRDAVARTVEQLRTNAQRFLGIALNRRS